MVVTESHKVRFFFSSRRRHTRFDCDWSSDVCSSDLNMAGGVDSTLTSDLRGVFSLWTSRKVTISESTTNTYDRVLVGGQFQKTVGSDLKIGRASCRERV